MTCYDCGSPCADTVCASCLALADERDYLAAYCRDEHDSLCRCIESVALARQLSAVHAAGKESD